jgi:hypothetical protein
LIGAYVNHIFTKLAIIILILLDIVFVIVGLILSEGKIQKKKKSCSIKPLNLYLLNKGTAVRVLDTLSLIFVIIFAIELCLRIFVEL